jgi:hypothetical protein
MLFRNKNTNQSRQSRRPDLNGTSAGNPVFSYHARSARTNTGSTRKAAHLFWSNDKPAAASVRPKVRRWPRRSLMAAGLLLTAVLVVINLWVSRDPAIIPLAGADTRELFLRPEETYQQAAREIMGASFSNTNKLTFNRAKVAAAMRERFPELQDVSVTLPIIGRQPAVYLQPSRPVLLLKAADGGLYIVYASGRALITASQVSKLEKMGLLLVEDQSGLRVDLGKTVLPSHNVAFITEVAGQLKAKQIAITAIILPASASELHLRIEGKAYLVKFNLRGDAREEAGAFLAVKQHLERAGKTPEQYIDVRVDNKTYYR